MAAAVGAAGAAAAVGEASRTVAAAALAGAEGRAAVGAMLGPSAAGPPGLELTAGRGEGVRSDAPGVGRNEPHESSPCFLHRMERRNGEKSVRKSKREMEWDEMEESKRVI